MRNRGIESGEEAEDYLSDDPERLREQKYSGFNLKDMDRAVDITLGKITEKKKIRIVGDYDIDGVTAVFILLKGLRKAGADVSYRIPHRIRDGYGLNKNIIEEAREAGIDTMITCDNGISAMDEITLAKEYGMTVIVTDHHEVPFEMEGDEKKELLPPADAVVDPKRSDCTYHYKVICGACVAYKFIVSLYEKAGIGEEEAEEFREIAAFATIGDVMPLKNENRLLVREGLKRLASTENPGIRALIDLNQLQGKDLTPYHVGFILGPCLNAAGRLDSADDALKLLLSEDKESAHEQAVILKEMNDSRKSLTEKGVERALSLAFSDEYVKDKVLVICLQDCHESIAGIIAGKVRERTGKPVFILTKGETFDDKPCLKGSGRSIEKYNMFEEMTKVRDLFIRFGGHAMAAGLSLPEENSELLRERLNENTVLSEEDLVIKRTIDMELPLSFVSFDLIEELKRLEPYGTDNEKPVFAARDVSIRDLTILGKSRNVLKGEISDGTAVHDCIFFGSDTEEIKEYIESKGGKGLKIIYSPDINEFRGNRNIQIILNGIK
ncbi:MAG: single-stranded-DNA-specific exonuclease RecJ [Lachnospiraceae bacterium]|nr:single-stranded-DNA-specific exonuclease RecJ [Lachnospiraceae bacterium]